MKNSAEVIFTTIPWRKTIQFLLTLLLFSSIVFLLIVYTITFTHHREGRIGLGLV